MYILYNKVFDTKEFFCFPSDIDYCGRSAKNFSRIIAPDFGFPYKYHLSVLYRV